MMLFDLTTLLLTPLASDDVFFSTVNIRKHSSGSNEWKVCDFNFSKNVKMRC